MIKTSDFKEGQEDKLFIIIIPFTKMIFYRAFSQLAMIDFVTWPPLQIMPDSTKRWPSDKVNHSYTLVVKMPVKYHFCKTNINK